MPTGLEIKYGVALSTCSLFSFNNSSVTWAWKNSSTKVDTIGAKAYTAIVTPYDNLHYLTTEVDVTVNGLKGELTKTTSLLLHI